MSLIAHRRRHTAEQRRHLSSSQRVTVDVIDKEQDVTAIIAESLRHRQAGQRNAQAVARGLIHLAKDHAHLIQHIRFLHLVIEVVALASALTHASKNRQSRVLLRDVVDQLHHIHGLADTGTAEQPDFSALGKWADQVDHLDAGLQQLHRGR